MKIEYVVQAWNAEVGEIKDVTESQANVLIEMGYAKKFIEESRVKKQIENVKKA